MSYAQMLAEKRANIREQQKALLDHAEGEKRELTAAENEQYDKMDGDLRSHGEVISKLVKAEEDSKALEESLRSLTAGAPTGAAPRDAATDSENEQLRRLVKGEIRQLDIAQHPDEKHGLFGMTKTEARSLAEARTLSKLTAGAGLNTVPTNFYSKLWAHLILTANLINAGATVLTTDGGQALQIPTTTGHSTAALTAEAAAISASDPVFAQRTLNAYKYATLFQVSSELLNDTGVDLGGYLSMQAGRAVGNALGTDLVVGNGTNKPTGITASTTLGVTGATTVAGAFTFDNLIDLYYSVIPQYRAASSAAWLMNDTSVGAARKLKDSQNRYLWEPSLVAGTPDTILNKPVVTDPNIAAVGLSAKSVVFGDLAAYFVRVVNGVRFEQSLDYAFNADLVTFRCIIRADGILVDQTGAVKHFIGGAT
jgi:HK97 family phage major capsid protein